MTAIFFDSVISDDDRRQSLYDGNLFVYSPTEASQKFCRFAGDLISEAFDGEDPETAQHGMPVHRYVDILKDLKPRFIHHEDSKRFVCNILSDLGCDINDTYFDVPRMRSSTSDGYLTTGIAYAWHPHRDTWYSAPKSQINIWLPIYDITATNTVAFHPRYFSRHVQNDSARYNYYEWNSKHRSAAAQQIDKETRPLPRPQEEIEMDSQLRVVCPVGGLIMFSGAQLHSSVPNVSGKTRFSIDFRVINATDIENGRGAPVYDVQCSGSNIRDFVRAGDLLPLPDRIVDLFTDGSEGRGSLVYRAPDGRA